MSKKKIQGKQITTWHNTHGYVAPLGKDQPWKHHDNYKIRLEKRKGDTWLVFGRSGWFPYEIFSNHIKRYSPVCHLNPPPAPTPVPYVMLCINGCASGQPLTTARCLIAITTLCTFIQGSILGPKMGQKIWPQNWLLIPPPTPPSPLWAVH